MSRYNRQIPLLGKEGQRRLRSSLVAIVGLGGIGSPLTLYLAGAGVNLRLIDDDEVSLDNLHRQILYGEDDVGLPKALVAEREVRRRNRDIAVEGIPQRLTRGNIGELLKGVDLVMDATDNFATRHIINKFCVENKIPFVYSAISGFYFAVTFIVPGETPCLRCIFPNVEDGGPVPVMGTTPAQVASIAATEAVKYLAGMTPSLKGKLLMGNLKNVEFTEIKVRRDPRCPICGSLSDRN